MSFMREQVTRKLQWAEIDGPCGITYIPLDDVDAAMLPADNEGLTPEQERYWLQYYEGSKLYNVSVREGFGSRFSAPGYLDCTEWSVYDSPEEALTELRDMYGDDEEGE